MNNAPGMFAPLDAVDTLGWVHFGDLHITGEHGQNYRDFLALVGEANAHLAGPGGVNFAFLPGDNADNGTEAQYRLVRGALDGLHLPVHILPGDHDIQSGNLDLFRRWLEPELPKSFVAGGYRCVFLNSVDIEGKEGFGYRPAQLAYLEQELAEAGRNGQSVVLFMHTYPSELGEAALVVTGLIRQSDSVRLVEMGHTHYNEIANDGRVIYAATRSTGQIEEGPVGFSLTCLDASVVSWKFKALGTPWPFVMITSPADRAFLTVAAPVVRGTVEIRARAWDGRGGILSAAGQIDDGAFEPMFRPGVTMPWRWLWDSSLCADGPHRVTVRVESSGGEGVDTINVLTEQAGRYDPPARHLRDFDNAIGAYLQKGIIGTQLGPNKNGHPW